MVKDNNKKAANKQQKTDTKKKVEVNDFFTEFLAKKERNTNKRLKEIEELLQKKKDGTELKKTQLEKIDKKQQLNDQIKEYNFIKNSYLEAYSKKDEYEPKVETQVNGEKVVENGPVKTHTQEDVDSLVQEAQAKSVKQAVTRVATLLVAGSFLNDEVNKNAFAKQSSVQVDQLNKVSELWNSVMSSSTARNNALANSVETLSCFLASTCTLSEEVLSNNAWNNYVRPAPVVEVQVSEIEAQQKVPPVPKEEPKTQSRKESELQYQQFMDSDKEDDDNEEKQEEVQTDVKLQKEEKTQPVKENEKTEVKAEQKPQKKTSKNDDDEEWIQVDTRPQHTRPKGERGGYRGKNYRGKNDRPYTQGGEKGERRPYRKREDGDYKGDREFKGERGEGRGEFKSDGRGRGRGGRGRGGRGRNFHNKDRRQDGEHVEKKTENVEKPQEKTTENTEPKTNTQEKQE